MREGEREGVVRGRERGRERNGGKEEKGEETNHFKNIEMRSTKSLLHEVSKLRLELMGDHRTKSVVRVSKNKDVEAIENKLNENGPLEYKINHIWVPLGNEKINLCGTVDLMYWNTGKVVVPQNYVTFPPKEVMNGRLFVDRVRCRSRKEFNNLKVTTGGKMKPPFHFLKDTPTNYCAVHIALLKSILSYPGLVNEQVMVLSFGGDVEVIPLREIIIKWNSDETYDVTYNTDYNGWYNSKEDTFSASRPKL